MNNRLTVIGSFIIFGFAAICFGQQDARLQFHYAKSSGLSIVIQHSIHEQYGVGYPITYMLSIPPGSSALTAYERYSSADAWVAIPTKSDSDLFNGIQAVRFDYSKSIAYLSAAFSPTTDTLFVRITDQSGISVTPGFQGVSKYYDNRQAVVTVTADDWSDWVVSPGWFPDLLGIFRSYGLYVTVGVITGDCSGSTWRALQNQLSLGNVEVASHSRSHSATPYSDPVGEIAGSKQVILDHVTLPFPFSINGVGLVYTWIAPYGDYDSAVDSLLGVYGYLDARLYANLDTTAPREYIYGDSTLTSWDVTRNHFKPFFPTVELGAPSWGGGDTSLTSLNSLFDTIVAKGDVYHLMWHPQVIYDDIHKPYLTGHLKYISGHKNIWYANLGIVYLYHMIQSGNSAPVDAIEGVKPVAASFQLLQNYPNPFNPTTNIEYRIANAGDVSLKVYDILGREVITLVNKVEQPGSYSVTFDARDLPSGVYFYRLETGTYHKSRKLLLLK